MLATESNHLDYKNQLKKKQTRNRKQFSCHRKTNKKIKTRKILPLTAIN